MTTPPETKAEGLAGAFGELVRMLRAHPDHTAGIDTTLPALAAISLRAARRGGSLTQLIEWASAPVIKLAMRAPDRPRLGARLSSMRRAWRRWEEPATTFKTREEARTAGYWAGVMAERHHTTAALAAVDVQRTRAEAAEAQYARALIEIAKGKT